VRFDRMRTVQALVLIVALVLTPSGGAGQPRSGGEVMGLTPAARTASFFEAMFSYNADSVLAFFPRHGAWTYQRTAHTRPGDRRGTWRIPSEQTGEAIRGELQRAFFGSMHAQPIGWFVHQVGHRGPDWKPVSPVRLVPRGALASSPVFIQWRREDEAWVIDAIGDESFEEGVPLPDWCC
jgi:hypothetical protein